MIGRRGQDGGLKSNRPRARNLSIAARIFCATLALAGVARAADPAPADGVEHRPILRDSTSSPTAPVLPAIPSSPNAANIPGSSALTVPHTMSLDPPRVLAALVGVVGLIFLLKYVLRRLLPGVVAHRPTRAMRVVSRFTIAPRQHLLMIQIGKRLVVVGDSGTQLNPLCDIREPDEVEELLRQVHEESAAHARRFDLFFGKARKNYRTESDAVAAALDSEGESDVEIPQSTPSGATPTGAPILNERSDNDPGNAAFDPTHELVDPSLGKTQSELSGLSEKVRELARQLGKS